MTVTWLIPADTGAGTQNSSLLDEYQLVYASDALFSVNVVGPFSVSRNLLSHTVSGLLRDATYYFRLRASNGAGHSAYAPTVSAVATGSHCLFRSSHFSSKFVGDISCPVCYFSGINVLFEYFFHDSSIECNRHN